MSEPELGPDSQVGQPLDRPPQGRARATRSRRPVAIAAGLAVLAALAVLVYRLTVGAGPAVTVPDLVGLSLQEARAAADRAGLVLAPAGELSDRPISTVLRQDPPPGATVAPGDTVAVVTATGPDTVVVPELLGLPESDAVRLLTLAGLTLGTRREVLDPGVAAGQVAGQVPGPGASVPRGTPVGLIVSTGPAAAPSGSLPAGPSPSASDGATPTPASSPGAGLLVVADYRCLTFDRATRKIIGGDFTVGSVSYTFSGGPVDDSWVVEVQDPAPGQLRAPGSPVDLRFSSPFQVCP